MSLRTYLRLVYIVIILQNCSIVNLALYMSQGFSKVVKCVPHPTPKGEKERGAAGHARRATLFLSRLCRRMRLVLAEQCDF